MYSNVNRISPARTWARIYSCDPSARTVQVSLRDGGIVYINVQETGAAFRWPKVGEVWTIRRDGNTWLLENRIEGVVSEAVSNITTESDTPVVATSRFERSPINSIAPGDLRLDAVNVYDGSGYRRTPVYVQADQPTVPGPYMWIQLDLPVNGWTLWFEDGSS
jgi:hypothetical protein